MRRRLLIALTVFAAIAVLAFAVPLSLTVATSRTQQLVLDRSGDADRFATLADVAVAAGDVRALADEIGRYHEVYGEDVLIVDAMGAPRVNAGADITDPDIAAAVSAARRNQRPRAADRLTPWGARTMLVARPVGTGVQVDGAVVIEASTARARADITRAWAVIAVGAALAMTLFTLLALVLSRWVLRPLAALSHAVAELTATLPKPRAKAPIADSLVPHGGASNESVESASAAADSTATRIALKHSVPQGGGAPGGDVALQGDEGAQGAVASRGDVASQGGAVSQRGDKPQGDAALQGGAMWRGSEVPQGGEVSLGDLVSRGGEVFQGGEVLADSAASPGGRESRGGEVPQGGAVSEGREEPECALEDMGVAKSEDAGEVREVAASGSMWRRFVSWRAARGRWTGWRFRAKHAVPQGRDAVATASKRRAPGSIARRYGGPPEMRAVAESFDVMALAVADSAEAQRQLVADTAHAMRNPLAALTIRLDSLEPAIPDGAATTFRGASAEVERLTALLDGLLTLAVAEAPTTFDADQTAVGFDNYCDAVQVVADRIDAWHSAYENAGIALHATVTPDIVETAVSTDVLAQILDVPLSNSCRYAGSGAHTVITVATEPGWVTVTVRDDGTGVPADEIGKLTTRFFRGSAAAAGGSGLGLPIAAALTAARGGALTVEATRPQGLSIHVRLPAVVRQ